MAITSSLEIVTLEIGNFLKSTLKLVVFLSVLEVVLDDTNSNLLRIPKSNEQKPEIKKVKKQETERKEYKIKDFVVYPKHGVGQITEFKKMNIGG